MIQGFARSFCGVRSGRIQPLSAVRADEALNLRPRCVRRSYPEISWSQVAASAVLVGFAYARASFARQDEKKDDWREFRARLVEQEKGVTKAGSTAEDTWLHGAKLLEKGSVLISHPGDHYSLDQQYFHKAVILIIKSDAGGDVGVILNRPTSWGIKDFGEASSTFEAVELHLRRLLGLTIEERPWKVSYGGPMCFEPGPQGDATLMCLHRERRNQRLKEGEEILNGLVLLPYNYARELVAMGQAQQEDFHLLSGYCGWAPGQLQDEVRNGGWQLLCAGSKALLPKTNQETLDESTSDGIEYWQSFQDALQAKTAPGSVGEQRADQALRRWIQQNLLKPPASAPSTQKAPALRLSAGTVLRGSASAWILGGQTTWRPRRNAHSRPPAQYLHKAVLLTITDVAEDEPAVLVILTGPQVGELPNGGKVFFGGLVPSERQLLQISGSYIWGQVLLPPHMLQELLLKGALEIAHGVKIQEVMDAPLSNRWAVAGGRLESINDAAAALLGDEQQRHWYQRYLGLGLEKLGRE